MKSPCWTQKLLTGGCSLSLCSSIHRWKWIGCGSIFAMTQSTSLRSPSFLVGDHTFKNILKHRLSFSIVFRRVSVLEDVVNPNWNIFWLWNATKQPSCKILLNRKAAALKYTETCETRISSARGLLWWWMCSVRIWFIRAASAGLQARFGKVLPSASEWASRSGRIGFCHWRTTF